MAMQQPPRPAQGMGPQDYYFSLVQQGMPPYLAYQAVQANFGPPKSPQQQAKDQAKSQQSSALAGAAGMIGGVIATNYVLNNAGKWIDKLTGQEVLDLNVINKLNQNYAQSGSIGISRQVPPAQGAGQVATPEAVSARTVTIDTPAGKQQVPENIANDSEFLDTVDWGQIAQGATTLLAAYQAYRAYKSGDKVGAGIYGATAATGAASLAGSELASAAMPYLGPIAGAYQGYQTAEMIGDTAASSQRNRNAALGGAGAGMMIGSSFGPVGMVIGAAVGGLAGAVGSWTGSHKGKAQFMRDNIRGVLQQGGILDKDFKGTLADGSTYDFGKDGSTLKWKEIDKVAAANPDSWKAAVPLTDALAAAYGFVGQKASDISAWYAKGAVSNANNDPLAAIANAQHFAQQQGITFDLVKSKLDSALKDNRINQNQYDYYMGGARQLTVGIKPQPAPEQTPPIAPKAPAPYPQDVNSMSLQDIMKGKLKNR